MKIVAFAASNSKQSINKMLIEYAAKEVGRLDPATSVEVLDLNDFEMPIYSIDRENESGIPEEAKRFFEKVQSADALMISLAEHNGSYTAAYKNIFDWASRIDVKVFGGKKIVAFSASPGGAGGASVLGSFRTSAPHFGGEIASSLAVGSFYDRFDMEDGAPNDQELVHQIEDALRLGLEA